MRAMLLAAGLGTRLRPLTDTMPKCLVRLHDRPMIDYPLLMLRRYGVREIVVNLHHFADQVEEYLGDGARFGVHIVCSREETLLDTGGGILRVRGLLDQGAFVVVNGDVLIDLRLDRVLRFHRQRGAAATLVLRKDPAAEAYGAICTDARGNVCRFLHHEAPRAPQGKLEQYMFTGVQVLEPTVFRYMDEDEVPFGITRRTYPRMLRAAERLSGFRFDGEWQDLGTPERLESADWRLRSGAWKPHFL